MFANEGSRCPVKFLELLISKQPQKLRCSGPLYLRPLESPHIDVWYSSQPVGIQTINAYMKNMAKLGNLDITNKNSQITALEKQLFVNCRRQEFPMTKSWLLLAIVMK